MHARRQNDAVVSTGWIANLGRFELRDLGLLVALVVWLVVPKPDTEARAAISTMRQEQKEVILNLEGKKQNKEASELQYRALSDKIDSLSNQVKVLDEKLDRERK